MAQLVRLGHLAVSNALLVLLLVSGLVTAVTADEGLATFYTRPYTPSACYGYEDHGIMIAAASGVFWNDGKVCGTKYDVKCLGGLDGESNPCIGTDAIRVMIVDLCPHGCRGTIDLSREVFAAIADPDAGVIKVSYERFEG